MASPSQTRLRALARHVRPAEFLILAYVLYSALYIWWFSDTSAWGALTVGLDERTKRVLLALLIVSTLHLFQGWVREPRPTPEHLERALFVGLCLAALPLVFGVWVEAGGFSLQKFLLEKPDDQLHRTVMFVLRVLGVGAPTLAIWLAVARFAKVHGRLGGLSMVVGFTRSALQTLREWVPLAFFLLCYWWMEAVVGEPKFDGDAAIQAIDRFLFFGVDPVIALQRFIWAPLSEWLAFSYSFYALFYTISLAAIFMVGRHRALREGVTALSLGLALTYVGYSLVPVAGPAMSQHFDVSLDLYYIKEVKEMLMDRSRITYDCFPSFHTAGSLIMSWLCWRHARKVFWVTLPMVVSTPLACVYLRYHYVTDVLVGGVLFGLVAYAVPRLLRHEVEPSAEPLPPAPAAIAAPTSS